MKQDLESAEVSDWLAEKLDDVNDLLDDVFLMLDAEEVRITELTEQVQLNAKTQAETVKRKAESVVALKQCTMEEDIISERLDTMVDDVNDETKNSKEDGQLVQPQLNEIEALVDSQIKSWNHCKSVLDEGDELNNLFQRENSRRNKIMKLALLRKDS